MSPSGQTQQSHIIGVTTECLNVVLNPLHQEDLVLQTDIQDAFPLGQSRVQEAQRTDTVVERYNDEGLLRPSDHRSAVVHLRSTTIEGTAMYVDANREVATGRVYSRRSEDIQCKTVFALHRSSAWYSQQLFSWATWESNQHWAKITLRAS